MAYFSALIILSLCALGIQAQKQESCQYSVTVPRSHLVPVGDCSATPMGPLESIKAEITELVHRENSRLEDQVRSMREALLNLTAILMAAHSTPNCPGEPDSNENTTRPRPVPNVVIAATHGCSQQCREAIDTCLAKTENITATECIVTCPNITCQNGEGRSVWGTDLYTDVWIVVRIMPVRSCVRKALIREAN
ncbi:hypothetical protein CAPTEDRAFT_207741 [Capitella teleta]|uniref:Uncharacterized protein n=1 Tax=Capitella teleta TaxID=283909 RepID=R7TI39_CAPTE|nr:hypothetical protein CAPTEDRAFT_207741 [Capitella teleta]|eukprot:ELT91211.1 hypothetical protein CAPTEDRAFT_207741 [Capitella teleta]